MGPSSRCRPRNAGQGSRGKTGKPARPSTRADRFPGRRRAVVQASPGCAGRSLGKRAGSRRFQGRGAGSLRRAARISRCADAAPCGIGRPRREGTPGRLADFRTSVGERSAVGDDRRRDRIAFRVRADYIAVSRAPVAQLDRVPDYGSGGWGFESSRARHDASSARRHPLSMKMSGRRTFPASEAARCRRRSDKRGP